MNNHLMKTTTLSLIAVGCLLVPRANSAVIGHWDSDGDGIVTSEEYHSTQGAQPWDGDTNGDGIYSSEEIDALNELAAIKQEDRENGSGQHLGNLDVNYDGRLSYEELQAGFPNVGVNPDTNGDNHIELSELEAVRDQGPGAGDRDGSSEGDGNGSDTSESQRESRSQQDNDSAQRGERPDREAREGDRNRGGRGRPGGPGPEGRGGEGPGSSDRGGDNHGR